MVVTVCMYIYVQGKNGDPGSPGSPGARGVPGPTNTAKGPAGASGEPGNPVRKQYYYFQRVTVNYNNNYCGM